MAEPNRGNTDDGEAARIARVYAAYRASARKHRAWAADNPGNVAMRAELLAAIWDLAGPELNADGAILDLGCGAGYWLEALANGGVDERRLARDNRLEESVALTLLPAVPRRLGQLTPRLYPALAACPALLTHRLSSFRRDALVRREAR